MKYEVTATIIVEADSHEEAETVLIEQMFQSYDMDNVYDQFKIEAKCTEQ